MLYSDNVSVILPCMVAGIGFLGGWIAIWNILDGKGRSHTHTFLDYCLAYVLMGVVVSLTFGQLGGSHDHKFLYQLGQDNGWAVLFAVVGGITLSMGDVAIQYTVDLLGMATGPAIINALAISVGVTMNFYLDNGKSNPQLLFPGMACAALATVAGALAHLAQQPHEDKSCTWYSELDRVLQQMGVTLWRTPVATSGVSEAAGHHCAGAIADIELSESRPLMAKTGTSTKPGGLASSPYAQSDNDSPSDRTHPGLESPVFASDRQEKSQLPVTATATSYGPGGNVPAKALGLGIAVGGGFIYALFAPAFNIATHDPFGLLPPSVAPLTLYTTMFYFSLSFAIFSITINVWFLYHPPTNHVHQSSLSLYLRDSEGRGLAALSGVLAFLGDLSQFWSGEALGYGASMLVQTYPLITSALGVFVYKELAGSSRVAKALVALQIFLYLLSIVLMAASSETLWQG